MRKWLRTGYEYLALTLGLGILGLVLLVWSPFAWLLSQAQSDHASGFVGRVGRFVNMMCIRFYLWTLHATRAMRFDITALDALRDDPPLIIAPNHPRLLDAFLVISRLPNVVCIMKNELMDNLLLRHGARLAGYIGNDSLMRMIRDSAHTLRSGNHLLLFPEGTRTVCDPVNPFTAAVALIAARARVPVQTVFIECDSPYLRKGCSIFKKPSLPITFRLRLGRRFDPPDDVRAFTSSLERYFRDELSTPTVMPVAASMMPRVPPPVSPGIDCANPT